MIIMLLSWIYRKIWSRRRLIFRYHDGSHARGVDPIKVAMAMHEHPVFLYRHLRESANGDAEAQKIVAGMACEIFNVKHLDGNGKSGLTTIELVSLVMAFDLYRIALKKNIAVTPTSRRFTESTSPKSSAPTTNDSLGYG